MREIVCDYLDAHVEDYRHSFIIEEYEDPRIVDYESSLEVMRLDGVWGAHRELQVAANVFQ